MVLSTEKAFDMLPSAIEIFEKLDLKSFYEKNEINVDGKSKDEIEKLQKDVGIKMIIYVTKNCSKIKEEVFKLLSIAQDKTIEDVKEQPFTETLKQFRDILSNKEAMSFFKLAMQ